MGRGDSRSSFTASIASSWSGVSRNGNDASSRSSQSLERSKADTGGVLALCVQRQQLSRQLADGVAGAGLDQLPRTPAELRERRVTPVRADIA